MANGKLQFAICHSRFPITAISFAPRHVGRLRNCCLPLPPTHLMQLADAADESVDLV
jgi:hypothetical protein